MKCKELYYKRLKNARIRNKSTGRLFNSKTVWGLSKEEIKTEFFLTDDDVDKYLSKRRFVFSIGEAIELLTKINKNERE